MPNRPSVVALPLLLLFSAVAGAQGRSTIEGRVIAADSGRPVPKATVRLVSDFLASPRQAETSDNGSFSIPELQPGTYSVVVEHPLYLNQIFIHGGVPRQDISIAVGQSQVARLDVGLLKGSVLTGRIFDAQSNPAYGALVTVERVSVSKGRMLLEPIDVEAYPANDVGAYRIWRLPPGRYLVRASSPRGEGSGGRAAPTWYPGVADVAEAIPLDVLQGQELSGIDFALRSTVSGTLAGEVASADGSPASDGVVRLVTNPSLRRFAATLWSGRIRAGQFKLSGVSPGSYQLLAHRRLPDGTFAEVARSSVTIGSDNPRMYVLLRRVPRLTGSLVGIFPQAHTRVTLTPVGEDSFTSDPVVLPVSSAGIFSGAIPPGRWTVSLDGVGSTGAIRRLRWAGRELAGELVIEERSEGELVIEFEPFVGDAL